MFLGRRFHVKSIAELPRSPRPTSPFLFAPANGPGLEGIERCPGPIRLRVEARLQFPYVSASAALRAIRRLSLGNVDELDLSTLGGRPSSLSQALEPLTQLSGLGELGLSTREETRGSGAHGLAPLTGLQGLTIALGAGTPTTGEKRFPPGRIKRLRRAAP